MIPNALVLVTDRLGCGYLGPYGNTWLETPAWNQLAARATLFETAIIDSPDLLQSYRSYWHGNHALASPVDERSASLLESLADQQIETWLITDERLVAEQELAQQFDHRLVLPPGDDVQAEVLEDTQLARVFATLLEVLPQAQPPFMIWVHAQAMQGPWDAPGEFRTQFAEEEDPDPPTFTAPPEAQLDGDYDPDLLLGIQHAYGGQVALLDACLGILLDALEGSGVGDSTALLATSTRGYPMGEHGYVGRTELPLFGELLHVPWINYWPETASASWRIQQMVQPPDMYTTLLNWFGAPPASGTWGRNLLDIEADAPATGDQLVACTVLGEQRSIRVPGWFLRRQGEEAAQLFVKPDDRWEFNEISNRCLDIVDKLTEALDQFEKAARAHSRSQLPPLAEAFLHGMY